MTKLAITTIDELPDYPRYLWGYDLDLSGWGEFGYPETPLRTFSMDWDEYNAKGEWENKGFPGLRQLCPVIYCCADDTDEMLLRFNCRVYDVALKSDRAESRGRPATEPEGGWDAWTKKFKQENSAFEHSIVYSFFAMAEVAKYEAKGMHHLIPWLMQRGIPHITVRTPESSRWYLEPGLGHTFFDEDAQPFKYCHPREYPKRGDYALQRHRRGVGKIELVTYQTSTYRGRDRRYKVIPC